MSDLITATEYVAIDSIPLATPAWRVVNVSELWQAADQDGSDTIIPGANGARPNPRWRRPTERVLELHIFGEANREGTPYANARIGLWTNVVALRSGLVNPPGSSTGTRTCIVHLGDGSTTLTGPVHVTGLEWTPRSPVWIVAALTLSIPAGQLELSP
jgi:hypothetical protein